MPDSRSVVVSTIAVMSLASTAQAGLLVSPTILGPGLEPAREIIDETIEKQLSEDEIKLRVQMYKQYETTFTTGYLNDNRRKTL